MSGKKKETYVYGSLKERFALEWKIYALAFGFILIADNIGQIKIPVGKGMFILFPIFYAIILGVLSGPQVLKIVDNRHVKAASKLVVVGICPFIAKLGITAGANIDTILQSGPSASWFWKSFGAAPGTACCNPAGHETGGHRFLSFHQQGVPHGAD